MRAFGAITTLAIGLVSAAVGRADDSAIRFSLDGEYAKPSTVEVKVIISAKSRGRQTKEDDYNLRVDARQVFTLAPRARRRVNGNAEFRIRQIDRSYSGDFKTRTGRHMIADTRPSHVPKNAFRSARLGVVKFGLTPSLAWPDSLGVYAERAADGRFLDYFITGGSGELRDIVSVSQELDLLRYWLSLTVPGEPKALGGTWKGQMFRFRFQLYGILEIVPDYTLKEIVEIDGRRTAKLDIRSKRVTYFQPLDSDTKVEPVGAGGVRGEAQYDIAGRYFRSALLKVLYKVSAKNAVGFIKPLEQGYALQFRYTRVK